MLQYGIDLTLPHKVHHLHGSSTLSRVQNTSNCEQPMYRSTTRNQVCHRILAIFLHIASLDLGPYITDQRMTTTLGHLPTYLAILAHTSGAMGMMLLLVRQHGLEILNGKPNLVISQLRSPILLESQSWMKTTNQSCINQWLKDALVCWTRHLTPADWE